MSARAQWIPTLAHVATGTGTVHDVRATSARAADGKSSSLVGDYDGVSMWPSWQALAEVHEMGTTAQPARLLSPITHRYIVIEHRTSRPDYFLRNNSAALIEVDAVKGSALKFIAGDAAQCGVDERRCPVPRALFAKHCGHDGCLFDLLSDPFEATDLAAARPIDLVRLRDAAYGLREYDFDDSFDATRNDRPSCEPFEATRTQVAWGARDTAGGLGVYTSRRTLPPLASPPPPYESPPPPSPAPLLPPRPPPSPPPQPSALPPRLPPRTPSPSHPLPGSPCTPQSIPPPQPASPSRPPPMQPPSMPSGGRTCTECPNIMLLLTEDQDAVLGGWRPTLWPSQLKEITRLSERGMSFEAWRVSTPLCAPSRASLQTGRYLHNLQNVTKTTPTGLADFLDPDNTGGRSQLDLGRHVWPNQFASLLRTERGYATGLFGKCMNGGCGSAGDTAGQNLRNMGVYSRWFEQLRGAGLRFFDSTASGCHWHEHGYVGNCTIDASEEQVPGGGYTTSVVGNATVEWIRGLAHAASTTRIRQPWFAYVAVAAPKVKPPKWYRQGGYPYPCSEAHAPRLPSWNYTGAKRLPRCYTWPPSSGWPDDVTVPPPTEGPPDWVGGADFHELVACQPPITPDEAAAVDELAKKRCASMLAVDDSLGGIMDAVEAAGEEDSTYVFVTSDHGYTLGHHGVLMQKGLLYEHNVRVPMIVAGPGIRPSSSSAFLGTHVDVAPTILSLAGITPPPEMDGSSLLPLLITETGAPSSVHAQPHGENEEARGIRASQLERDATLIMHYNQGPWGVDGTGAFGRRYDDWSNTYVGLLFRGTAGHFKFGMYDPFGKQTAFQTPHQYELFDLDADPHELANIYNETARGRPGLIELLIAKVRLLQGCVGVGCADASSKHTTPPLRPPSPPTSPPPPPSPMPLSPPPLPSPMPPSPPPPSPMPLPPPLPPPVVAPCTDNPLAFQCPSLSVASICSWRGNVYPENCDNAALSACWRANCKQTCAVGCVVAPSHPPPPSQSPSLPSPSPSPIALAPSPSPAMPQMSPHPSSRPPGPQSPEPGRSPPCHPPKLPPYTVPPPRPPPFTPPPPPPPSPPACPSGIVNFASEEACLHFAASGRCWEEDAVSLCDATCNHGCALAELQPPNAPTDGKNVLYMIVDDMRPEGAAYGQTHVLTPNMNTLARTGLTFERAYCQVSLCSPSRQSFMSGRRPDRMQVFTAPGRSFRGADNTLNVMPPEEEAWTTLPGLFKKRGWRTYGIGKAFDGREEPPNHDCVQP